MIDCMSQGRSVTYKLCLPTMIIWDLQDCLQNIQKNHSHPVGQAVWWDKCAWQRRVHYSLPVGHRMGWAGCLWNSGTHSLLAINLLWLVQKCQIPLTFYLLLHDIRHLFLIERGIGLLTSCWTWIKMWWCILISGRKNDWPSVFHEMKWDKPTYS